jgi:serine protease DegQ
MRKTWLLFSQAVTVAVALLFVVATLKPEWIRRGNNVVALPSVVTIAAAPTRRRPPGRHGRATVMSYSAAAKQASPAVVSITASKAPPRSRATTIRFRFFFGDRQQRRSSRSRRSAWARA